MRGIQLTNEKIAEYIKAAGKTCLLVAPGVDSTVAKALQERARHEDTKAIVVIDGSHYAERSGYGETNTWRGLLETTELKAMPGTRLGMLVTERGAWLFAPSAGKLDLRNDGGLTAVILDEGSWEAARSLAERIVGQTNLSIDQDSGSMHEIKEDQQEARAHGEGEPRAQSGEISKKDVEQAERAIEEHPPRDYSKEREISVYSAFVGYIELRLAGSSLAKGAWLRVPKELVERGLGEDEIRKRINESVKIDLEEEVDTGVREINERINAIRTLYTRQLGNPHGRIYRKRQREELEGHLCDLKREIARANSLLGDKINSALRRQLDELAETYAKQSTPGMSSKLTKEDISRLLREAWDEAGAARPREVKLEVTFKDLTWEALQDKELKQRIVAEFPDLENSTLYREYRAHASTA
ncbi:MAG: hypothetical protein OXH76_06490 [Boseongicola sp.]|nr:hypothetical protein [Boseongicola sp.]